MTEDLIATIEDRLGRKIVTREKLDSKGGKYLFRLTDESGVGYSYKELEMVPGRYQVYHSILTMGIPVLGKNHGIFRRGENRYGVLTEWAAGRTLEPQHWRQDEDALTAAVREAALELRRLHREHETDMKNLVTMEAAERILDRDFLTEEEKELLRCYFRKHLPTLAHRNLTVVHGDFHLKNVIRGEHRTVFIDLDDIKYGDAYTDLVYAANLHYTHAEDQYYYLFLRHYFGGSVPADFWPAVNIYSIVKALDIIDYEMKNCAGDSIRLSMRSLLNEHDGLRSEPAGWYIETEKKLQRLSGAEINEGIAGYSEG